MAIKYRVHFLESERGWGQKWEYDDYDTRAEAEVAFKQTNAQLPDGPAPDYYYMAHSIEVVEVPDKEEEEMVRTNLEAKNTDWDSAKAWRLLHALASAKRYNQASCYVGYKDNTQDLWYSFDLATHQYGLVSELTHEQMLCIEVELQDIAEEQRKQREIRRLQLLANMTAEDKELLGIKE